MRGGECHGRTNTAGLAQTVNNDRPQPELVLIKPMALAAQLGVSRTWLYDAAKSGRIPSIRIGGDDGPLRFVPADVERWIDDARARWAPGPLDRRAVRPVDIGRGARARQRARR